MRLIHLLAIGPRKALNDKMVPQFHGDIEATTPNGSCKSIALLLLSSIWGTVPCTDPIRPAVLLIASRESLISNAKYDSVEPVSVLQKWYISSFRLSSSAAAFKRISLLSEGPVSAHTGSAFSAAATAAWTSLSVAAAALYSVLSVQGDTTS